MSNPFKVRAPRRQLRFVVVVAGKDDAGSATRQEVGQSASQEGAIRTMIRVLQQWEKSHGAIRPGTTVTIWDKHDGGKYMSLEYLGFGDTLL